MSNTGNETMRLYAVGDSVKAVCGECKSLQTATFQVRDVPFSDGIGIAKGILAGVCTRCSSVIAIPNQSAAAVREARKQVMDKS